MKKPKSKKNLLLDPQASCSFKLSTLAKFHGSANAKASAELRKAAKKAAQSTAEHFKKDKWDLDLHFITTDMLYDILGAHPQDVLLEELAKLMPRSKLEVQYHFKSNLLRFPKKTKTKKKAKK